MFRLAANLVAFLAEDPERRRAQWTFFPLATLGGLIALAGSFAADRGGSGSGWPR